MKKKLLIVTLNDYIIYQPTILNLYDQLIPFFDVEIVSFKPSFVTTQKDETRKISYLSPAPVAKYLWSKFDFLMSKFSTVIRKLKKNYRYEYYYYNNYLPSVLENWLRTRRSGTDLVIAVDLPALHVAQKVFGGVHFLSLEVDNKESLQYRKINLSQIKSVFIQSQERIDYMFPGITIPVFIVQNSPVFAGRQSILPLDRKGLIFAGTARSVFGIFECIDYVRGYPDQPLIQKGGGEAKVIDRIKTSNADLIEKGLLKIDNSYLPAENYIQYLSGFRIGFCFYSWHLIREFFNYRTAPSGKLFMYMAAGVPVIACDIPGFEVVKKYNAGVLITDYFPATIRKAAEEIEKNYEMYSDNCYRVAEDLSFDRMVQPYIEYLRKQ